jgi:glycosyltransferase involved in cell wall biosynthesis
LSSLFGSPAGGAEVATELLFNGLRNSGHSAYIVTTRKPVVDFEGLVTLDHVSVIPTKVLFPGTSITDHILASYITKKLQEIKPDIIHTIDTAILPATIMANKKLCLPCVVTNHANVFDCPKKLTSMRERLNNFRVNARNKTYLMCLKNVDAVISVSDYIKKELIFAGVESSKIQTIYNIPSDKVINTVAISDEPKSAIMLFALGRMIKEKGFDVILKAMKLITEKECSIKLVIAGNGPEMPKLKKLVKALGLESFVLFTGWLSRNEVISFYAESDIVLLPSVFPDANPLVSFEAMSFGKPVVASNTGGIPEAVVDGVSGFLVPSGNADAVAEAVLRLVRDRCLRERMGQAGREILEKRFIREEIVRQTVKLYEEVIRACAQRSARRVPSGQFGSYLGVPTSGVKTANGVP